jgi:hypothetical protein
MVENAYQLPKNPTYINQGYAWDTPPEWGDCLLPFENV